MTIRILFLLLLGFVLIHFACNDPSFVGSELLEDDLINSEVQKDFDFRAKIVTTDSILVYDAGPLSNNFHLGSHFDEFFGRSRAEVALQLINVNRAVDTSSVIEVDSVVLSMAYNPNLFFGDSTLPMSIEVLRITDYVDRFGAYFSNHVFPISMEPLGSIHNFLPKPNTPITRILDPEDEESDPDTVQLVPQFRIELLRELGAELLSLDTISVQSDSLFLANFGGIYLRSSMGDGSLIGIDPASPASAVAVYYRANGENRVRRYVPEAGFALRAQVYQHDHTIGSLAPLINQWQDSVIAVQGISGLGTELEIAGMEDLRGAVINQARMKIFLNERPQGGGFVPDLNALALRSIEQDGAQPFIEDLQFEQGRPGSGIFGGIRSSEVIENDTVPVFGMNITGHLQRALKKDDKTRLLINPRSRLGNPARSLYYGPAHPDLPVELRVIYTR
ncbi:MAG: DUF4270 family protein [Saprospirales bacterium]|nr:MAG: DUF4270 family protein [Saprospirales bacterium]